MTRLLSINSHLPDTFSDTYSEIENFAESGIYSPRSNSFSEPEIEIFSEIPKSNVGISYQIPNQIDILIETTLHNPQYEMKEIDETETVDETNIIDEIENIWKTFSINYKELIKYEDIIIKNSDTYEIFLCEVNLLENMKLYENYENLRNIVKKIKNKKITVNLNDLHKNLEIYVSLYVKHRHLKSIIQKINNISIKNKNKCNICYIKDVNKVLIPCGHTICSDCEIKLDNYKCHMCRKYFNSSIRFFL